MSKIFFNSFIYTSLKPLISLYDPFPLENFLSKFGFTAAPIVLGIILGPIAETNFNQAKIIADTQNGIFDYLTSGPLNLTIIALCLISILYGVYGDKAKRGKK